MGYQQLSADSLMSRCSGIWYETTTVSQCQQCANRQLCQVCHVLNPLSCVYRSFLSPTLNRVLNRESHRSMAKMTKNVRFLENSQKSSIDSTYLPYLAVTCDDRHGAVWTPDDAPHGNSRIAWTWRVATRGVFSLAWHCVGTGRRISGCPALQGESIPLGEPSCL